MSIAGAAAQRAGKSASAEALAPKIGSALAKRKPREDQRWSFGFRFFREIKNFGMDSERVEKRWLVSVMERLGEMSKLTLTSVLENPSAGDGSGTLRMHNINWKQRNIPIARADLHWIDPAYLDNDDEYPLFQLAVSTGKGRLVGFLDEDSVYQIVLLDPLHNAQPSKHNDYKVRLSRPLGCEMTAMKAAAAAAFKKLEHRPCGCEAELRASLEWDKRRRGEAIVMPVVEGSAVDDADDLIEQGLAKSYIDIFEAGLVAVLDSRKSPSDSEMADDQASRGATPE